MVICYNTGIIVAAGVIIVGYICCGCDSSAVWLVPYNLSWLRLFFWDVFCTPLIITATIWLCSELTLLVLTEAVVFVVFFFLLLCSFNNCSLSGYYIIRCWLSKMSCDHYYIPHHLVISLMSILFLLFYQFVRLVLHGIIKQPYRGLLCLQIGRLCPLFLLSQISWPSVSVHTFLMMAGSPRKVMV